MLCDWHIAIRLKVKSQDKDYTSYDLWSKMLANQETTHVKEEKEKKEKNEKKSVVEVRVLR